MFKQPAASCLGAGVIATGKKVCALLLALLLCFGAAPVTVWADASSSGASSTAAQSAGSATLSIVKGVSSYSGSNALVNKTYKFTEGATVGDLLEAAKKAGDIAGYSFSDTGYGSYLNSVTLLDGTVLQNTADYSSWWSTYKNGAYVSGTAGQESDVLANGDAVQFAWCDSYPNIEPTATQWDTLKSSAAASDTVAGTVVPSKPGTSGSQETSKVDVTDLDKSLDATYRSLFKSLAASCKGSGGASERNVRSWQAMEAAAIGQQSLTDKGAAIAEAVSAYKNKTTDLPRCIIVLTALGVDATKVPSSEGPLNLVERLANDSAAITGYPTSSAFALLAYACGPYDVSENAVNSPRKLIDELVGAQAPDGSYKSMGSVDVDTTAMVIPALAAYQDDATAQGALGKAVSALCAQKKKDGSFGNVNSTSVAIVAFASAGVDSSSEKIWGKNTPLCALLNMAKGDSSGFKVSQGMQEDMVNEQGFRALVAHQGMKNAKAPYNIYTQAKAGQAGLSGAASGGSSAGADGNASNVNDSTDDKSSTKQNFVSGSKPAEMQGDMLSQTSDDMAPYAGVLVAIVLGSLITSTASSLRSKKETMLHR